MAIGRQNDSPCAKPAHGWVRPKVRPHTVKTPARGLERKDRPPNDTRMITITFDTDTFNEVRDRAVKNNISFSEQIRRFAEWGLESC